MDIRTKLIFTLVAVALTSMFAFGAVMVPTVETRLRESRLDKLDELAASKRETLRWVMVGWQERLALVASRTQLRESLAEHARGGGAEPVARMTHILEDAIEASSSTALLRVYDETGQAVAWAEGTAGMSSGAAPPRADDLRDADGFAGVVFDPRGAPLVRYIAPLELDGDRIGTLEAHFVARELPELVAHDHGLGETGEILLVARDVSGAPRTLHPTRHEPEQVMGVVLPRGTGTLAWLALSSDSLRVAGGIRDYRGEEVWVATRPVPEAGWGVAVKVDAAEEEGPFATFRGSLRQTALILSAFAILAGFGLGLRFAMPIHALAEVADRIRAGDLGARAEVRGEDEVGVLARTFNDMAGELEEQMTLLHEFRHFFDVSLDMMCIAGIDGYFKRVNPSFTRILGWSYEELTDRPFFAYIHPDDIEPTEREIEKLSEGIPTISFDNRFLCRDGGYKMLRWNSHPDPETGMLYAIARVVEEIGEPLDQPLGGVEPR